MTFAIFINLLLALLCAAVLVQSARMMRSFNAIRSGDLAETVKQLDRATAQARGVLAELKTILATDGAATTRTIASGETLRDELSVMVGIGNAVAERIMEAASNAGDRMKEEQKAAVRTAPKGGAKPATRPSAKSAAKSVPGQAPAAKRRARTEAA